MGTEINELTDLAYEGSGSPLTTSPVVGTPARPYADRFVPGTKDVAPDEMRVTISDMRTRYDGPVVISQDLTVFNVTEEAVVARQATIDPYRWPVIGASNGQGPPMNPPLETPAWCSYALTTD